jgi:hypothetical protein
MKLADIEHIIFHLNISYDDDSKAILVYGYFFSHDNGRRVWMGDSKY